MEDFAGSGRGSGILGGEFLELGVHPIELRLQQLAALDAAFENILSERAIFDPWNVNQDAEYIETTDKEVAT